MYFWVFLSGVFFSSGIFLCTLNFFPNRTNYFLRIPFTFPFLTYLPQEEKGSPAELESAHFLGELRYIYNQLFFSCVRVLTQFALKMSNHFLTLKFNAADPLPGTRIKQRAIIFVLEDGTRFREINIFYYQIFSTLAWVRVG